MAAAQILCGYFLTLFFCYYQVSLTNADATWDMEKIDAKQGDDVTITCTASEIGRFDVVRIEKRRIRDGEVDDDEVKVADSRTLNDPYKESGRHEVLWERSPDKVAVLKLHFKGGDGGIRGEDAGEYSCFALNNPDKVDKIVVNVAVPIEEVYLFKVTSDDEGNEQREKIESGGELTLAHGADMVGIGCHASMSGSLDTIDDMKVKVDNMDETSMFKLDPEPSTDDQATDETGFWLYSSQKDLIYVNTQPREDFNNKKLVCSAHHGGKSFKKRVKASVTLKIEFPPKISCSKGYDSYATVGGALQIACMVHSNPRANVTWNQTESIINSPREEGNIRAIEEQLGDDKVRTTLNVQKVTKEHITPFRLSAENKLGKHSITINVIEGKMPDKNDNSLNDNPGHNPGKPGEVKSVDGGATTVLHSWSLHLFTLTSLLVLAVNNR